jgi:hypothetical protein
MKKYKTTLHAHTLPDFLVLKEDITSCIDPELPPNSNDVGLMGAEPPGLELEAIEPGGA